MYEKEKDYYNNGSLVDIELLVTAYVIVTSLRYFPWTGSPTLGSMEVRNLLKPSPRYPSIHSLLTSAPRCAVTHLHGFENLDLGIVKVSYTDAVVWVYSSHRNIRNWKLIILLGVINISLGLNVWNKCLYP